MIHHLGYNTFGYGGMIFGGLLWIAFIIAIIFLIVWAIRKASGSKNTAAPQNQQSPLEIAKLRYANGELTREEYQALLDDLK